ncbi:MAG TPA: UvrD-helicase domain-containing protein [Acidobacteriota bacterium]|nr:UvrD-helicase domain-containing protein [Acidobacteriota bacterium]
MATRVLISEAVKRTLLAASAQKRAIYRKAFEFLENGLWDGGLRIKKLRGLSNKTVLEGRLGRSDRLLMTLGREAGEDGEPVLLAYVWAIVEHDRVDAQARAILPENAPFLSFKPWVTSEEFDVELERLDESYITQEPITARLGQETSAQKWFVLDEKEWKRVLLYSRGDFDIFLYLTPEQRELLRTPPPVLVSGTAGSGKTTMAVYYLAHPRYAASSRLFLTYNLHLRNFSERLYRSLVSLTDRTGGPAPEFLTFKELCLRLLSAESRNRFAPEREVKLDTFKEMIRRMPGAAKLDAALVWEEIRSIIKGAKPQLDARVLRGLVAKLEAGMEGASLVAELREELLALKHLSLAEKAESTAQRLMGLGLREIAADLSKHLEVRKPALVRTLSVLAGVVDKHEADFRSPLMTFAEYERLGRKRAPAFLQDREHIYQIAEWYQKNLNEHRLWDEIDLTRAAIRALDKRAASLKPYDLVCCDEVQDFTDIQLSLIVRLPSYPGNLVLCGDPKQIVNPSGFRWEEVKDLFYDRAIPVPAVHHLTLNFRCVGSIVLLSNTLLELKQRLLGVRSDERLDDWKFQGRPPFLIEEVSPEELIETLRITAPDRVVLTRSDFDRDFLKEQLGTELVFTIQEAKGLEFGTVVLWKFGEDASVNALWTRMLSGDVERLHDAQIRHEINLLYVGITRAQKDLILYDGPVPSPIWSSPLFEDLIHRSSSLAFVDEAWRTTSSPADWERQGDYFMDFEHYRAAAECYRNADLPQRMAHARALAAEKVKDFETAAGWWDKAGEPRRAAEDYERAGKQGLALPIWQKLGEQERAEDCRLLLLEEEGHFAEAATAREKRKEYEKAIENWRKAGCYDREAKLWEKLKNPAKAVQAYVKARDFQSAAKLYLKLRRKEDAARCLEDGGRFAAAMDLWRKLKMPDELLRCAKHSRDPLLIGEAHEHRSEWRQAVESYRRSRDPERRERWQAEAALPAQTRRAYARKAVRLELLEAKGAGEAWLKAGELELAAEAFGREGDFDMAGKLYARRKRFLDAAAMYVRSPNDRAAGYKALEDCYWRSRSRSTHISSDVWAGLARNLRHSKEFEAAAAIYSVLRMHEDAGACLVQAGRIEDGFNRWLEWGYYESLVNSVMVSGHYRIAISLMEVHLQSTESAYYNWEAGDAFARIVSDWSDVEGPEVVRPQVVPMLERLSYCLPFDFLAEILVPLGWMDVIASARETRRWSQWTGSPYAEQRRLERWHRQARELENAGDVVAAGMWYLGAKDYSSAKRCWAGLEPNERNLSSLCAAGYYERVADFHLSRGDLQEAGEVLCRGGDIARGAPLLEQAGCLLDAADQYKEIGDFENACRLYLKANSKKQAASMLEKLKRWAEAEALYIELGNEKRAAACAKKAKAVRSQKKLF